MLFCKNMDVLLCESSLPFLWVEPVSNLSDLLHFCVVAEEANVAAVFCRRRAPQMLGRSSERQALRGQQVFHVFAAVEQRRSELRAAVLVCAIRGFASPQQRFWELDLHGLTFGLVRGAARGSLANMLQARGAKGLPGEKQLLRRSWTSFHQTRRRNETLLVLQRRF